MPKRKTETIAKFEHRNADIIRMFDMGFDIEQIGAAKAITKDRVRQILKDSGRKSSRKCGPKTTNTRVCRCGARKNISSRECRACASKKMMGVVRNSKITADLAKEINSRLLLGETTVALADEYGLTDGAVSHIQTGRTWSHVTGRKKAQR